MCFQSLQLKKKKKLQSLVKSTKGVQVLADYNKMICLYIFFLFSSENKYATLKIKLESNRHIRLRVK